jgi:aryl-alcohol dehydrogenase-like predicted oxidoreductase
MEIVLTRHSIKRLKERLGLPKKACQRMAQTAFDKGITFFDTAGAANKYFRRIYDKNRKANNVKVYGKFAYIFSENTLITVLPLPKDIKFNNKNS